MKECKEGWGYKNKDGYYTVAAPSYGGHKLLHRYIYATYHEIEFEETDVVRHTCNNPSCVEITHLVLGSQRDNILDSIKAGRYNRPSGANHWASSLTEEQILDVIALHNLGMSASEIAKDMEIKYKTVWRTLKREVWS